MFKIGDIIEATESSNEFYSSTTEVNKFVGEVTCVNANNISVKCVSSKVSVCIGRSYWVHSKYFQLHKNNITTIRKMRGLKWKREKKLNWY